MMCMLPKTGCKCPKCSKPDLKVTIVNNVEQPAPPPRTTPHMTVEQKVQELMDMVDSGHESMVEWDVLTKFYRLLCGCKQTPRVVNLKEMISPLLSKYGYYGIGPEE